MRISTAPPFVPLDTDVDLFVVARALAFSAHKHRDQRRLDAAASPYINHPIALMVILTEAGIRDTVTLASGLLHDTVEDTETTWQELAVAFGEEVANVVAEVSDDKTLSKGVRKRLQVEHAAHISYRARLVKLADKISNLTDVADSPPTEWTLTRRQKYFDWALEVVTALGPVHPLLEDRFARVYLRRPAG